MFEKQLDKITVHENDEYMAYDFSQVYNTSKDEISPLLWVRFTKESTSQIELELKYQVVANSVCVRLLDIDDRTKDD